MGIIYTAIVASEWFGGVLFFFALLLSGLAWFGRKEKELP